MVNFAALIEVLSEVRERLARPDADFAWSAWDDQGTAIAEVEALLKSLACDDENAAKYVAFLFAPTSDLQEVSMSSGWAHRFLELAEQVDKAVEVV